MSSFTTFLKILPCIIHGKREETGVPVYLLVLRQQEMFFGLVTGGQVQRAETLHFALSQGTGKESLSAVPGYHRKFLNISFTI